MWGGFIGQYFESLITQSEIRKAFTHVAAETRSCINGWDMAKGLSTEYLEPGAPVTMEEAARFYADFARELPSASVVTLSGSIPSGMPKDCYAKLIRMCHEANKPVLLDTSGDLLRSGVKALPSFIKPNADEIAQLTRQTHSTREELIQAAVQLHESGIPTVAVSLGEDGALVACGEGVFWGKPPRIEPKNTVGCGDSMVAGFAVGMVRNLPIAEQLRLAVAVSAANTLSMSTGGYDPRDMQSLLSRVEIQRIQ